jgi:ABC-type multidrug transport system fused ATPase/permease subunit
LRTSMAVITQAPVLFSGCTIRENLDPYPTAARKDDSTARIQEALESVHMWETIQSIHDGVDGIVADDGSNFSVGQRQLLCLARAIVADSRILVLDEATANVDTATDEILQRALRKRFAGATIIAIAHRLDTIMDYDKVLVLGNGRVLEYGSPSSLLENEEGQFYSMVESTGTAMREALRRKVKTDA